MLIVGILYMVFGFNLVNIVTESGTSCYKDIRFWFVIGSIAILLTLTANTFIA